jgi:branched-chain amino acid aminotransferase/4-amino-4-deoxychorismate lyase
MIPADDRGFTLGDGLFETLLAVDGEPRLWDAHLSRLQRGCAALALPSPDADACRAAAAQALEAAGLAVGRAALRISWTAGSGGRGLDRPAAPAPRLVATAAPAPRPGVPVRLHTASIRRNDGSPASRLKTLAYLDNVLARREATAAGAEEAVMLNTRGEVACAAAGNLFWLRDDVLSTPELSCGALDGVVRARILERAAGDGWRVLETRAGPEALQGADAVFVTNSLGGVRPASAVDGHAFASHTATVRLQALVRDAV